MLFAGRRLEERLENGKGTSGRASSFLGFCGKMEKKGEDICIQQNPDEI